MTEEGLRPKSHAEAVALFRAGIVGHLPSEELRHGELRAELRRLAKKPYRAPGAKVTRYFGVSTLERWHYLYKNGGLEALMPRTRSDQGNGRKLRSELRELLLDIRREHPAASTEVIIATLVSDGRMHAGEVSPATLRRLFRAHGLDRKSLVGERDGVRLRWQAAYPVQLWHADVCHGPALSVDGRSVPLRIHAILDDCSRYVVALRALSTERESDMLLLFADAVRSAGCPGTLYLDNGSTYSGQALATAAGRLGVSLVHARPYDPQSRGKMERFWRTLRGRCLDHLGTMHSLHDVQVRLLAWLERDYHARPHGGLLGKTPKQVWAAHTPEPPAPERLDEALTARERRRVRKDGTLSVGGKDFEVVQGFLAGRVVTVARSIANPKSPPYVEHEGRRLELRPVDAVANARRPREPFVPKPGIDSIPFDPAGARLNELCGKRGEK